MPLDKSIKKVLVIGSGPIVIGQAAEFDYSGSQACRALREEGVRVVLVNSNPATIQTDPEIADVTYVEPLRAEFLEKIIEKERPDGLIATMGGQTALNLATELHERGVLGRCNVRLLGTGIDAITRGEDREKFASLMKRIGEPCLDSVAAGSVEQALAFAEAHRYPFILRPAYTLGGTGGGVAHNRDELVSLMEFGLRMSRIRQVLVEESVIGWGEFEYEVMRDARDNCITICSMENMDPMGVHTGESIVVAPAQTLSDNEHQMLRSAALKIIRALDIRGGCNIQYALNQGTGEYRVIEVNPRLSRSSALASKATGYPIARVATKIALGYSLDEIENSVTKKTPACFEPALDYIVVKLPRWPFDKMPEAQRSIGTQMKSTGEVMGIGRTFEEALQKAIRSLDTKRGGICCDGRKYMQDKAQLAEMLRNATDMRLFAIYDALVAGFGVAEIAALSNINQWFLRKMGNMRKMETLLQGKRSAVLADAALLLEAKRMGFGDRQIAFACGVAEQDARAKRIAQHIKPVYKMVDTCAAEFEAATPYYYSTHESESEARPKRARKVVIIGSGPIRIGQGIEFDYCCCHASFALREAGVQSIMINNNPETVSTDFDASDRLYFEPITLEDVMNVIEAEQPEGVIVQFGGQTSINLALPLAKAGVRILGTQTEGIDIAEDRERFRKLLGELRIPQPANGTAMSEAEALAVARRIGYPIVVRPSYVIAGRAMQIVYNDAELKRYISEAVEVSEERPVLIDKYLENAVECEVDALCDGSDVYVAGIMEHIEKAGIHSGDSSCVTPPVTLSAETQAKIAEYTRGIALALKTVGAINIQYAVQNGTVYVLEANPRASRTIPYLSKATGVPLAKMATRLLLGATLDALQLPKKQLPYFAVKSVVFPFLKLPGTDFALGPEMKSTGESMGIDKDFGRAYYKALLGANLNIQMSGKVAITLNEADKKRAAELAREFSALGFEIAATDGTAKPMLGAGMRAEVLRKVSEGTPNIVTKLRAGEIALVINTPKRGKNTLTDGFKIRRAAIESNTPCITTLEAAFSLAQALRSAKKNSLTLEPIGEYHKMLL